MLENVIQIKSGITTNFNMSVKIQQSIAHAKKNHAYNPSKCACNYDKYC